MTECVPKRGRRVPLFPGVSDIEDIQEERVGCGWFTNKCGFSVRAIYSGEGEDPSHSICIFPDGKEIRPWCGASDSNPPEISSAEK